jgi:hypothetical protein
MGAAQREIENLCHICSAPAAWQVTHTASDEDGRPFFQPEVVLYCTPCCDWIRARIAPEAEQHYQMQPLVQLAP